MMRTKHLGVRFEAADLQRLKEICGDEETISSFVRKLVKRELDRISLLNELKAKAMRIDGNYDK